MLKTVNVRDMIFGEKKTMYAISPEEIDEMYLFSKNTFFLSSSA